MRHAIHRTGSPDQRSAIIRFPFLVRAGIPQGAGNREVYWIDKKNVEATPFDSEYLERLKARDPRTQEHFAGHFNRLLAIKLRSHSIYGSQLDDLRQDTLIRALKSIYEGKVDSPERLPAFVYGVCSNVIKEHIRGEITARVRDTNEFPDLPDSRYSADDSVRHQEVRTSVRHVLKSLPEKDRAILIAVFIAEHDKDAICQKHGITRDYLRVLLHRSLINARKVLDKRSNG
jgi:RNA polymerase sigma-70 factor, ECF subfamily